MKIIRFNYGDKIESSEHLALCLGYFDGVHLGHQTLIKEAINEGYKVAVLSFDNSPAFVLGKKGDNKCLTTLKQKSQILADLGVDIFYVMHLDSTTLKISKVFFIENVLKAIKPQKVICGQDYSFGYLGEGNPILLQKYFDVTIMPLLEINHLKVSSRNIIELVKNGEISKANELLTRPYTITGKVTKGLHNGHKIGFPTANIESSEQVVPHVGVYIGYGVIDNKKYKGIISVGTHPSIHELNEPIIEINLLDFSDDIYGKDIEIEFVKFIRPEIKFLNIDDLKAQLQKDTNTAKKSLQ